MVLYNTQDILGVCRRDFGRAVLVGGVAPRAAEPGRLNPVTPEALHAW